MATLTHTQSRRMYSWWWDSHISPKNSKWLQDNLTDMDSKLKAMIKLIEEDADSFARRAEMYYKKRPELMKLVEDFYRAYRALAERYDHATVVIRQAHRTMTEAFPNQVPPILGDDSPAYSASEDDPRTPDSVHTHAPFQTDNIQKDAFETSSSHYYDVKSNEENAEGSDFVARKKGIKQSNNLFGSGDYQKLGDRRVRKGLNFQDMEEKEQSGESGKDHRFQALSESGQVHETDEILKLRKAIAELEAEKETGHIQYQQSLDKLSKLEAEISRAQEDSRELSKRASIAEAEVRNLKEAITKSEADKDVNLLQYYDCLEKISSLEDVISQLETTAKKFDERASTAETQAQSLKDELAKFMSEKDVALDQYVLSLEKISNLENRLELAEEDGRKSSERAEKAEREIESLRQEVSKLSGEKEAAATQYQHCLETISSLENKLSSSQEEAQRLRIEIGTGVAKLKGAEEQCTMLERSNQSLHTELESLTLKMGTQGQELSEKQKEVSRLWSCVQEERLRFVEAETAFQTLQHLHAKVQEELHSVASELQNRVQMFKDVEAHNQVLQNEILKIKEENLSLNELNVSSAMSLTNMQEEITILKDAKGKLEEEVELRVDQRNALQQEIYCLKEELNDLNKKHLSMLEQVHTVGFKPESLKSSVTELQDENSNLKESCARERSEKQALLEKLEILGQLLEKNSILENSLSDLSAELEAVRGKINALEESCHFLLKDKSVLLDEKASLGSHLQAANENLEKLSGKNTVLENSLSDAHDELQKLKVKLKSLEDLCQLLADQKAGLAIEKDNLSTELEITLLRLEELEKTLAEVQERYLMLEKDKASALCKIEELETSFDEEKQEHATFAQMNEKRFALMQSEMHLLQEECHLRKREYDIELDRALHSELEIFILQRCGEDLKEANKSLSIKYEKLLEASTLSENLISQLQKENIEQQNAVRSLSHQTSILRKEIFPLLEALDVVLDGACQDTIEQDLLNLTSVLHKIEEIKQSLEKIEEENQQLGLEKMALVTLLQQLRLDAEGLTVEKSNIEQELKTRIEHFTHKIEEIKQSLEKTGEENQQLGLEKMALVTLLKQLRLDAEGLAVEKSNIEQEVKTMNEHFTHKIEEIKQSLEKTEEKNQQLGLEKMALVTLLEQLRLDAEGLTVEKSNIEQELKTRDELFTHKIEEIKQSLEKTEEENQQLGLEKMALVTLLQQLRLDAEALAVEKSNIELELKTRNEHFLMLQGEVVKLQNMNEELKVKLTEGNHREEALMTELGSLQRNLLDVEGSLKDLHTENLKILEEKQSWMDETLLMKDCNYALEEENYVMCGEMLSTAYLSLIFKNFTDDKNLKIQELGEHLDKLQLVTDTIQEKLNSTERTLEEVQIENHSLRETLQKSEHELKIVTRIRDILSHEIEMAKNLLHEEQEKVKFQEDIFQSELQKQMNEIEILESNAAALFGQLQTSTVYLVLYERKIHELAEAFDSLSDANTVKDNDIKLLKERVMMLTAENEGLNVQLAAYGPAVASLKDCLSSLENKTSSQGKIHKAENGDLKGAEVAKDLDVDNFVDDENVMVSDAFLELQNLQNRIQAIEQKVVAEEQLVMQEKSDVHSQLEAALRQIEELKSESSCRKNFNKTIGTSEVDNVLLTKDIILDEASECSPNGNSWKQQVEPNYTDQDDRTGLAVDKAKQMRKLGGEYPASDAPLEKELSIDRLEFSKNSMDHIQEGNNRKVLQRLNSDVQKLMNLHITVQDLKRKLEITGKSRKGKAVDESDTLKEQLEEAESTILQLFDFNGKLMKNMEGGSFSSDNKSTKESGDFGSARREISGQARRVSEKIGRLQLEVQKIQFVLLKLDEKRESKGRKNPSETNRRVLLRDYLYGGLRTNHMKGKKSPFCACLQPKTYGD